MKRSTACRLISATLLIVFVCGSMASVHARSLFVKHDTHVIKPAVKAYDDLYVNDATIIEVPVNNIGFHDFVLPEAKSTLKEILPVAHAPPNTDT